MASVFKNDGYPECTHIVLRSDGFGQSAEYFTVDNDDPDIMVFHGTTYMLSDCTLCDGTLEYPERCVPHYASGISPL